MSHSYICLVGNTPELSVWELRELAISRGWTITTSSEKSAVFLESETEIDAAAFFQTVGGTVKLCEIISNIPSDSTVDTINDTIATTLENAAKGTKILFAIGEVGRQNIEALDAVTIKRLLQAHGYTASYKLGERAGLETALLQTMRISEVVLFQHAGLIYVTLTRGVQSLKAWTQRDRSKPYFDRKKGMLPPKVARMMVNLVSQSFLDSTETPYLYDPFCGTGTVLLEAALTGYTLLGSDLDYESTLGTTKNLAWLESALNQNFPATVITGDASTVTAEKLGIPPRSISAIVSEPFLGKQTPNLSQLPNIFKGLEKLYLGSFKNWRSLLKPGAEVVIIFPEVIVGNRTFNLDSLIDKLALLGYTSTSEFVRYARPNAVITRQIRKFRFQPN